MDKEKLAALNTTIQTVFKNAQKDVKDPLNGVLYDVTPVNGAVVNVVSISSVPGMKEFKSERKHGEAENVVHTMTPSKWEATLDVKRENIEDDALGQVPAQVRMMVAKSSKHYGLLAQKALSLGFDTTLSDGKAFFAKERGNLITGALTAENFSKAYDALLATKDGNGDIVGATPTHLLVGVENRAAAEALVAEKLAGGATNPNYNRVEVVVVPAIEGKAWFVTASGEGMLPVTIAERIKTSAPVAKNDLNSDRAFETDIFSWGLRGRYDAAYQAAQFIVGSKGA